MQGGAVQHRDRLVPVQRGHRRVRHDAADVGEVFLRERHPIGAVLQQRPSVRRDHGVTVEIHHVRVVRVVLLRYLVHVETAGCGQAGTAVEELGDPRVARQEPRGADQKSAVAQRELVQLGECRGEFVGEVTVCLKVVFAADNVVIRAGHGRLRLTSSPG